MKAVRLLPILCLLGILLGLTFSGVSHAAPSLGNTTTLDLVYTIRGNENIAWCKAHCASGDREVSTVSTWPNWHTSALSATSGVLNGIAIYKTVTFAYSNFPTTTVPLLIQNYNLEHGSGWSAAEKNDPITYGNAFAAYVHSFTTGCTQAGVTGKQCLASSAYDNTFLDSANLITQTAPNFEYMTIQVQNYQTDYARSVSNVCRWSTQAHAANPDILIGAQFNGSSSTLPVYNDLVGMTASNCIDYYVLIGSNSTTFSNWSSELVNAVRAGVPPAGQASPDGNYFGGIPGIGELQPGSVIVVGAAGLALALSSIGKQRGVNY